MGYECEEGTGRGRRSVDKSLQREVKQRATDPSSPCKSINQSQPQASVSFFLCLPVGNQTSVTFASRFPPFAPSLAPLLVPLALCFALFSLSPCSLNISLDLRPLPYPLLPPPPHAFYALDGAGCDLRGLLLLRGALLTGADCPEARHAGYCFSTESRLLAGWLLPLPSFLVPLFLFLVNQQ